MSKKYNLLDAMKIAYRDGVKLVNNKGNVLEYYERDECIYIDGNNPVRDDDKFLYDESWEEEKAKEKEYISFKDALLAMADGKIVGYGDYVYKFDGVRFLYSEKGDCLWKFGLGLINGESKSYNWYIFDGLEEE